MQIITCVPRIQHFKLEPTTMEFPVNGHCGRGLYEVHSKNETRTAECQHSISLLDNFETKKNTFLVFCDSNALVEGMKIVKSMKSFGRK